MSKTRKRRAIKNRAPFTKRRTSKAASRSARFGMAIDPRRQRRKYRRNDPGFAGKRHYRRNPINLGSLFTGNSLKAIGMTAGGFVAIPFIEGFLAKLIPVSTDTTTRKITGYVVKIGSVIGLSWLATRFLGADAGNKVAIGAGAYVAVSIFRDVFPNILPIVTTGAGRYLRAQPLLGAYQRGYMGSAATANVPSRLQPQSSY